MADAKVDGRQFVTLLRIVNADGVTVEPGNPINEFDLRVPPDVQLAQGAIRPAAKDAAPVPAKTKAAKAKAAADARLAAL